MADANSSIRDAIIRHQINLQNLSAGMTDRAVRLLDATEQQIVAEIRAALADGANFQTRAGLRKLQALEDSIRSIRSGAFQNVDDVLNGDFVDLVRHEAEWTATTLDTESPTKLDTLLPAVSTINAVVEEEFEGASLGDWLKGLSADDSLRIINSVKIGLTRGLSTQDIVRLVVGSTEFDGTDGATNLTRNKTATIVRTALNFFSNRARSLLVDANKDLVKFEMYHATLDNRTSAICRSLDGKIYKVGEGRFPPQHFNCRSVRVPVLDGQAVGQRPFKASTEKQLVQEFAKQEGLTARTRASIPRGLKRRFDDFARIRARELTGQAPAATTYSEFLRRQTAFFQDQVLGPTKGQLFRRGGLTLDRFVSRAGQELTLHQLATTERSAFIRAGLDPRRY